MSTDAQKVIGFYSEYHGHLIPDLEVVHRRLRHRAAAEGATTGGIIWLAGDSSLDNKYWLPSDARTRAVGGYADVLEPPTSVCDVAHCLNQAAVSRGIPFMTINCAVEESSIQSRACGQLLDQDVFLRDHVQSGDIVVVSLGGNDIALQPTCCTVAYMLSLICCSTTSCIQSCSCGCACPCDDCCAGCGPGCWSGCLACPFGLGYFIHMFSVRIKAYVERLISGPEKPKKVLVCMIYYPDETEGAPAWADFTLSALGYNKNPKKLQALIQQVFRLATQRIRIPGTEVVGVPLFQALDGKNTADYVQRVEPSAAGGAKMAQLILDACCCDPSQQQGMSPSVPSGMARVAS